MHFAMRDRFMTADEADELRAMLATPAGLDDLLGGDMEEKVTTFSCGCPAIGVFWSNASAWVVRLGFPCPTHRKEE